MDKDSGAYYWYNTKDESTQWADTGSTDQQVAPVEEVKTDIAEAKADSDMGNSEDKKAVNDKIAESKDVIQAKEGDKEVKADDKSGDVDPSVNDQGSEEKKSFRADKPNTDEMKELHSMISGAKIVDDEIDKHTVSSIAQPDSESTKDKILLSNIKSLDDADGIDTTNDADNKMSVSVSTPMFSKSLET